MAGVSADDLSRIFLGVRFRRRGESQDHSARRLMEVFKDGRGELELVGLTMTDDRGYGKETVMGIMSEGGVSSIFVLPQYLLQCNTFVGQSILQTHRDDEIEDHGLRREEVQE